MNIYIYIENEYFLSTQKSLKMLILFINNLFVKEKKSKMILLIWLIINVLLK
jgi:hypothetical protein